MKEREKKRLKGDLSLSFFLSLQFLSSSPPPPSPFSLPLSPPPQICYYRLWGKKEKRQTLKLEITHWVFVMMRASLWWFSPAEVRNDAVFCPASFSEGIDFCEVLLVCVRSAIALNFQAQQLTMSLVSQSPLRGARVTHLRRVEMGLWCLPLCRLRVPTTDI